MWKNCNRVEDIGQTEHAFASRGQESAGHEQFVETRYARRELLFDLIAA
jgi:hypothetical protein